MTCPYLEVLNSAFLHFKLAWKSHQPFDVKVHIGDTHPQLLSWSPVQVATSSVHSLLTIGTVFNLCSWSLGLFWIYFFSMIWANQHQLLTQVTLSSFTQFLIHSLKWVSSIYFSPWQAQRFNSKAIPKHEYISLQLIQHRFKELSHQWGHGKKAHPT